VSPDHHKVTMHQNKCVNNVKLDTANIINTWMKTQKALGAMTQ